jgi:RimJ/RimL family protein N-acetyltransferase
LESERLILRPVMPSDAAAIFAYAGDPEVTRFLNFPRHEALTESDAFARRCIQCWQDGTAYYWAITERRDPTLLGGIELRLNPPRADFGYVLNRRAWGFGYASEATSAVVAWSIAQPQIFRVWATCHPDNARSIRVLEKSGLTFEGRLENWEARPNLGEAAGASLVYARVRNPPAAC